MKKSLDMCLYDVVQAALLNREFGGAKIIDEVAAVKNAILQLNAENQNLKAKLKALMTEDEGSEDGMRTQQQ